MPVCQGCGGSYDDGFKFCPNCGRAKPEPESLRIHVSVSSEDRWETCRLVREIVAVGVTKKQTWRYCAEATGPMGIYPARKSPVIWGIEGDDSEARHILIDQLSADGWESVPTSGDHFRRRLSSDWFDSEECEIEATDFRARWDVSFCFHAFGRGPKGFYTVWRSPAIKGALYFEKMSKCSKKILQAHAQVVDMLVKDGWDVIEEHRDPWFSYRFRRPVRK